MSFDELSTNDLITILNQLIMADDPATEEMIEEIEQILWSRDEQQQLANV